MNNTKRNHYNPCFWTANWNPIYYQATRSGTQHQLRAREQRVHVLNVMSANVYETAVDNVHFEKKLGNARMTPEALLDFCNRNYPDRYEEFKREMEGETSALILDFESFLTGMENSIVYDALRTVLRTHRLNPPDDKANLAAWMIAHHQRSHAMMTANLEFTAELGQEKFEHFIHIRWLLSHTESLYKFVMTLVPYHWHLYHTQRDTFPLNDSPILIAFDRVFVPLSPRLLLEVDRTKRESENCITTSNYIRPEKMEQFRLRMIANSYREIIFSSPSVLETWKGTAEFASRRKLVTSSDSYIRLESKVDGRELWNVNALANRLS